MSEPKHPDKQQDERVLWILYAMKSPWELYMELQINEILLKINGGLEGVKPI